MEFLPPNPNELTLRRRFGASILLLLLLLLLPLRAKAQSPDAAQVYLPIVNNGAGQGDNNTGPTSIQLIEAAVMAGKLSAEQDCGQNKTIAFVIDCIVQVPGADHTTNASGTLTLQ